MRSVSVDDIKRMKENLAEYVRYLIRLEVFPTQKQMAEDLGIAARSVRQTKYQMKKKKAQKMSELDRKNAEKLIADPRICPYIILGRESLHMDDLPEDCEIAKKVRKRFKEIMESEMDKDSGLI